MIEFNDAEPEDAWDPDDPLDEQIANLRRRLPLLGDTEPLVAESRLERLDEIRDRLDVIRARLDLDDRERLRIRHLDDDLDLVRARLGDPN